jgi:hypothetical protein
MSTTQWQKNRQPKNSKIGAPDCVPTELGALQNNFVSFAHSAIFAICSTNFEIICKQQTSNKSVRFALFAR